MFQTKGKQAKKRKEKRQNHEKRLKGNGSDNCKNSPYQTFMASSPSEGANDKVRLQEYDRFFTKQNKKINIERYCFRLDVVF